MPTFRITIASLMLGFLIAGMTHAGEFQADLQREAQAGGWERVRLGRDPEPRPDAPVRSPDPDRVDGRAAVETQRQGNLARRLESIMRNAAMTMQRFLPWSWNTPIEQPELQQDADADTGEPDSGGIQYIRQTPGAKRDDRAGTTRDSRAGVRENPDAGVHWNY